MKWAKEFWPVWLVSGIGALWRIFLAYRFAGWEESDYGNLAMVRGVWDSGFTHFDMNHMPGYYAFAALFLLFTEDTVVAAKGASLIGGVVSIGLVTWILQRMAGIVPALLCGVLLVFQPEFALYSSSSLREPLYAAFLLAVLLCILNSRAGLAGCFGALAFSVRFEAPLALALVGGLLWAREGRSAAWRFAVPILGALALWAAYCQIEHGTYRFWSHAAAVNVETGLGGEATDPLTWGFRGLEVSLSLIGWLLPWRIGWMVWIGLMLAPWVLPWRSRWSWLILMAMALLGIWAAIAFFAQHEPNHNLYWKWLCPLVPFVLPVGVVAIWKLSQGASAPLRILIWTLCLGQAGWSYAKETSRQVERADQLYAPQVDLARWLEEESPSQPVLLDNIPACWIGRKPQELSLVSWFDVPVRPNDPSSFANWLMEENVWGVLWFAEEWTQSPVIAPFLAHGGTWTADGVVLKELRREDSYGWIFYRVMQEGDPP
jgi:hypothetical protein